MNIHEPVVRSVWLNIVFIVTLHLKNSQALPCLLSFQGREGCHQKLRWIADRICVHNGSSGVSFLAVQRIPKSISCCRMIGFPLTYSERWSAFLTERNSSMTNVNYSLTSQEMLETVCQLSNVIVSMLRKYLSGKFHSFT